MKNWILSLCLIPSLTFAQDEFKKVWEGKFAVDAKWNSSTADLHHVLGGDMTEIEMLDGTTGRSLWTYNFKEKHGVKKCEDWIHDKDSETVKVIIQKSKNDPTEVVYLEDHTGAVVAEEQLPARVKEKKQKSQAVPKWMRSNRISQSSCYDKGTNTTIDLSYDHKTMMNAGKGTDLNITVEASGANAWKTSFTGKVVRHLNNEMLPADDGEVILNVSSGFGKVFVVYEGITCIDLVSGKVLWNTTFDNCQTSVGLRVTQEIGRSAMPLAGPDGVYICDLTKDERTIKKLDLNTGAVIWQADKLSKSDIISEVLLVGNNLIARFGGLIRIERYIPGMSGNPDVYKVEYTFEGSTSIRAYDATTGKPVWNTEAMELPDNFKKSECSMMHDGGQVMACGEKNLYVLDAATGKLIGQAEYNAKTIGKAKWLYGYGGNFMIEGDEGIALMKPDGTLIYATNTDKCLMSEMCGEAFIVWTGKDVGDRREFIRFDPVTGKIMGKLEDCYHPRFDTTGDLLLKFDGSKVTQYRTN